MMEQEKPKIDSLDLERIWASLTQGPEDPPPVVICRGRVWMLRPDGGYDSRPITDEDCGE
jgi:hypothetical protein